MPSKELIYPTKSEKEHQWLKNALEWDLLCIDLRIWTLDPTEAQGSFPEREHISGWLKYELNHPTFSLPASNAQTLCSYVDVFQVSTFLVLRFWPYGINGLDIDDSSVNG